MTFSLSLWRINFTITLFRRDFHTCFYYYFLFWCFGRNFRYYGATLGRSDESDKIELQAQWGLHRYRKVYERAH